MIKIGSRRGPELHSFLVSSTMLMALKLQGTATTVRRRYCNLDKQYKVKLYINTHILRLSLKDKCWNQ